MKKIIFLVSTLLILCSHDMFLKMETYFLEAKTPSSIFLYNGTFESSDNVIDRNRMIDVCLVGNGLRSSVDTSQWTEKEKVTVLNFISEEEGTWMAGVSTKARSIELEAKEFNEYLEHDGVLDMLDFRTQNNTLEQNAIEKYSKHVKTIFQVGQKRSDDWKTPLNYPIEFVPLSNPYEAKVGEQLSFKLLRRGTTLPNHLVYAGSDMDTHTHTHDHSHGADTHHHHATEYRTDKNGLVTIKLLNEGIWYLRTIHMEHSNESGLTHESNWATITFGLSSNQIASPKAEDQKTHGYLYLLIAAGIIILFLGLRRILN